MADDTARNEWVKRVLGVAPPSMGGSGHASMTKLLPIWIEAKEEVDAGIAKLQEAPRAEDDDDLRQIAEFGLYGATDGENVRLMAALREADGGGTGALKKVAAAVRDYLAFLDAAPIVDLIEDNPFGVAVPMRRTLGSALAELERLATV